MPLACHSVDFSPLRTSPQRNDNWHHQKAHPDGSSGPARPAHAAHRVLPRGARVTVLLPFRGVLCLETDSESAVHGNRWPERRADPENTKKQKYMMTQTWRKKLRTFFPLNTNVCLFSLEQKLIPSPICVTAADCVPDVS